MKHIILGALLGALVVAMPIAAAQDFNTYQQDAAAQSTAQDIANFRKQMVDELNKQQEYVNQLGAAMTDTSVSPMFIAKVELGNAMIQLDVKKTLVANFWTSTTLASPVLRSVLLQTLQKEVIMESDLAYLQTVADIEKAKLQATQQAQAAQAAPSVNAPQYAPPTPATPPTSASQVIPTPAATPNPTTAPVPVNPPSSVAPAQQVPANPPSTTTSGNGVVY